MVKRATLDFEAINGEISLLEVEDGDTAAADTCPRRGIENSDVDMSNDTGGLQLQHTKVRVSNLFRGQQGGWRNDRGGEQREPKLTAAPKARIRIGG